MLDAEKNDFQSNEMETNNNYVNSDCDDVTSECERASDDLMAIFNHAHAVYHRRKVNTWQIWMCSNVFNLCMRFKIFASKIKTQIYLCAVEHL